MDDSKQKNGLLFSVFDFIEAAVFSLVCVAILFTFVFRTVSVDGGSMTPTLSNADRLILTHLFYTPRRGDIVVISRLETKEEPLIKRVIAVAGDTVQITADGKVYLNGELLEEPYISVKTPAFGATDPITIEEGYIFVMGDNRTVSKDSRLLGPIPVSKVMGKAVFRLWPAFGGIYAE
ncbi:MAG: signal peptidase I [Clostridia bacterium]|nr:signal peptidase I [Clostridia bacterium]